MRELTDFHQADFWKVCARNFHSTIIDRGHVPRHVGLSATEPDIAKGHSFYRMRYFAHY